MALDALIGATEAFFTKSSLEQAGARAHYSLGVYAYIGRRNMAQRTGLGLTDVLQVGDGRFDAIRVFATPITQNPPEWVKSSSLFYVNYLDLLWDKLLDKAVVATKGTLQECHLQDPTNAKRQFMPIGDPKPDPATGFEGVDHWVIVFKDPQQRAVPPEYIHRVPQANDSQKYVISQALASGFGGAWQAMASQFHLVAIQSFEDGDAVLESQPGATLTWDQVEMLMTHYTTDPNGGHGVPFLVATSGANENYVLFGKDPFAYPIETDRQQKRANLIAIGKGVPKEQVDFVAVEMEVTSATDLGDGTMGVEAVQGKPNIAKRKAIEAEIISAVGIMEPSGLNAGYWKSRFAAMSDTQFHQFMVNLQGGKEDLYIIAPNTQVILRIENLLAAAKKTNTKIFHRLWKTDPVTRQRYLTTHAYPVFNLPTRRAQQFSSKKIATGRSAKRIDALTGTVTGEDRAAGVSAPEIHIFRTRGLHNYLHELLSVRGGDVHSAGEFNRQLEETGVGHLSTLTGDSRARSATIARILLRGVHLKTNL